MEIWFANVKFESTCFVVSFLSSMILSPWEDKALKEDAWTLKGLKNKERRIQVSKNYDFKKVTLPRYCSRSLLEEEWTIDHVEHRLWDHITRTCRYFFPLAICLSVLSSRQPSVWFDALLHIAYILLISTLYRIWIFRNQFVRECEQVEKLCSLCYFKLQRGRSSRSSLFPSLSPVDSFFSFEKRRWNFEKFKERSSNGNRTPWESRSKFRGKIYRVHSRRRRPIWDLLLWLPSSRLEVLTRSVVNSAWRGLS